MSISGELHRRLSSLAPLSEETLTLRGGGSLDYQCLGAPRKEVLIIANGLGAKLYAWLPLLPVLLERFEILCWNYRDLFPSAAEKVPLDGALSITRHGADLIELSEAFAQTRSSTPHFHLLGWSMGVQVCITAALQAPARFQSLLLLNGCGGGVLTGAFRLSKCIPSGSWVLRPLLAQLQRRVKLIRNALSGGAAFSPVLVRVQELIGDPLLTLTFSQYLTDLSGERLGIYLELIQRLDEDNPTHGLDTLSIPATVVSGHLDPLTPRFAGESLSKLMGAAHEALLGTHFLVFERSERLRELTRRHFDAVLG